MRSTGTRRSRGRSSWPASALGAIVAPAHLAGVPRPRPGGRPRCRRPSRRVPGLTRFVAIVEEIATGVLLYRPRPHDPRRVRRRPRRRHLRRGHRRRLRGRGELHSTRWAARTSSPGERLRPLVIAGLNHAFYMAVFGAIVGWPRSTCRRPRRVIVLVLGLATATLAPRLPRHVPAGAVARARRSRTRRSASLSRLVADARQLARDPDARGHRGRGLATRGHDPPDGAPRRGRGGRRRARPTSRRSPRSAAASAARSALLRTGGLGPVLRLRRRYAAEGELAFHKWRLTRPDAAPAGRRPRRRAARRDPPPARTKPRPPMIRRLGASSS